ncbi:hypothetical protein LTR66_003855 [Elasticomyces elasticus]|nr:hypothetical protein LTR66_003855 [Elasticomyces elasticus]
MGRNSEANRKEKERQRARREVERALLGRKNDKVKEEEKTPVHQEHDLSRQVALQCLDIVPASQREPVRAILNDTYASLYGPDWLGRVETTALADESQLGIEPLGQFSNKPLYEHALQAGVANRALTSDADKVEQFWEARWRSSTEVEERDTERAHTVHSSPTEEQRRQAAKMQCIADLMAHELQKAPATEWDEDHRFYAHLLKRECGTDISGPVQTKMTKDTAEDGTHSQVKGLETKSHPGSGEVEAYGEVEATQNSAEPVSDEMDTALERATEHIQKTTVEKSQPRTEPAKQKSATKESKSRKGRKAPGNDASQPHGQNAGQPATSNVGRDKIAHSGPRLSAQSPVLAGVGDTSVGTRAGAVAACVDPVAARDRTRTEGQTCTYPVCEGVTGEVTATQPRTPTVSARSESPGREFLVREDSCLPAMHEKADSDVCDTRTSIEKRAAPRGIENEPVTKDCCQPPFCDSADERTTDAQTAVATESTCATDVEGKVRREGSCMVRNRDAADTEAIGNPTKKSAEQQATQCEGDKTASPGAIPELGKEAMNPATRWDDLLRKHASHLQDPKWPRAADLLSEHEIAELSKREFVTWTARRYEIGPKLSKWLKKQNRKVH